MAISQTRARPRKAETPEAAKAPATRSKTAAAKKAVVKKAVAKEPDARKAVAKKAAVKKAPVGKTAGSGRTVAAAKVAGSAKPVARKTPAASRRTAATATKAPAASPRGRSRVKPTRTPDLAERLRALVGAALDDLKAKDIREIDVRGKSSVTDLLVLASGTSSRHVKSIADEVVKKAKQAGLPPIGVEGQREGEWVLVDLGDIVVHVMLPRTREFYDLERLWTVGDDEMPTALAG